MASESDAMTAETLYVRSDSEPLLGDDVNLATQHGDAFSFSVMGYEFPDEELGPTEDNPASDFETGRFLIVDCTFAFHGIQWVARAPLMDTTELDRLVDWLKSVRVGNAVGPGVCFTERDLEFSTSGCNLCVHVFRDFLPVAWHANNLTISFPLEEIDLNAVLESLRDVQRRYPGKSMPG